MNLLCISGSLRKGSFNTLLVREAAAAFGEADVAHADIDLPLYNEDVEKQGMPPKVQAFLDQITSADAIVIATPEYNKGLSGVLKNALDWSSRVKPMPLTGKPVALLSAAAGRTGGVAAQMTLRHCLLAFNARLLQAPEVSVASAHAAFKDGALADAMARKLVGELMGALRAEALRGR